MRPISLLNTLLVLAVFGLGITAHAEDQADESSATRVDVALTQDSNPQDWPENALSLIVMDPLAAPLSCPCVEGYAQRDYTKLAEYLEAELNQPVRVAFAESLGDAMTKTAGRADIVVGKDSVVVADAKKAKLPVVRIARLTDLNGKVTQKGLIVVRASDKAKTVADLKGYKIIFGPADSDEKHSAARTLLVGAGIPVPEKLEVSEACSEGACKILEWGDKEKGAAVISSYAAPLLEGCGTIKKGDLRILAETQEVPFVTAFVAKTVKPPLRKKLRTALKQVGDDELLKVALESKHGFRIYRRGKANKQPGSAEKTQRKAAAKKK